MLLPSIFCILSLCSFSHSLIRGPRTLVLLENQHQEFSHSIFFDQLLSNTFELTIRLADDSSLALSLFGDYLYDNLLIMAPSTEEFGGDISAQSIVDFIDSGHNVFLCVNSRGGLCTFNINHALYMSNFFRSSKYVSQISWLGLSYIDINSLLVSPFVYSL